ncbi:transcription initiation factor TFIID subunit 8 [Microplitis mediator]|uniref:transcription initiation factor TFIID subunit 8 n=1 Tax=Microplitis mediator TaxID=375433 RepID=UPI002553C1F2|nr:transcription initiation factor TFIID subunit 8 [Microplitis mediator]
METLPVNSRRKILNHVVCGLLAEYEFVNCEKQAFETLTEMLQSFLVQVGESTKNYCELAGRTEPLIADVILSLINMGFKLDGLDKYALRHNRTTLPSLQQQTQSKQVNILQAGDKHPHPPHIPNYLPAFPDPHAYIRTPTHKQPVTEYEAIREKAATQKRDTERALTRFVAKTSETHSLFLSDDNSAFLLIACKPQFPPYLSALMPQDQVFEPEIEFDFERTPVKKRKDTKNNDDVIEEGAIKTDSPEPSEEVSTQQDIIDNPYLRPGKVPKNKVTGPGSVQS